jgi:hypothetical protein
MRSRIHNSSVSTSEITSRGRRGVYSCVHCSVCRSGAHRTSNSGLCRRAVIHPISVQQPKRTQSRFPSRPTRSCPVMPPDGPGISLHDGFRPRHRRQADVQDHRLFRAAEGRPLGAATATMGSSDRQDRRSAQNRTREAKARLRPRGRRERPNRRQQSRTFRLAAVRPRWSRSRR